MNLCASTTQACLRTIGRSETGAKNSARVPAARHSAPTSVRGRHTACVCRWIVSGAFARARCALTGKAIRADSMSATEGRRASVRAHAQILHKNAYKTKTPAEDARCPLRRCGQQGCERMCQATDHWHTGEHDCGHAFHACPNQCTAPLCARNCAQNLREEHVCECDDATLIRPSVSPSELGSNVLKSFAADTLDISALRAKDQRPVFSKRRVEDVADMVVRVAKEKRDTDSQARRVGCLQTCGVENCRVICADLDHHRGNHEPLHTVFPHHCGRNHPCSHTCAARGCDKKCLLPRDSVHGQEHMCMDPEAKCALQCAVVGCSNACASADHFHCNDPMVQHKCLDAHPCRRSCSAPLCQRICGFQRDGHSEDDLKTVHDCGQTSCLFNCGMPDCSNPCNHLVSLTDRCVDV